ncbi:hypothetical protein FRB95_001669 [Tulasnella sp. JGI-2019a]|nr:hypothetical protein FRB95_001669 [Tulasnella sp. JGI-2019a]
MFMRLVLAAIVVYIAFVTKGLATPVYSLQTMALKKLEQHNSVALADLPNEVLQAIRNGRAITRDRVQDLLKSDTPIRAAFLIRDLFLVDEGDADGPIEIYERTHGPPDWQPTRSSVPVVSETMEDEINEWVSKEVSPRAVWWLLQLIYPAEQLWINEDTKQVNLSPAGRVAAFWGLSEDEREKVTGSILGSIDQLKEFQFIEVSFTLEQAEDITRVIVLNSEPTSEVWFDAAPIVRKMPEGCAASRQQVIEEFKKLPKELQVVVRELSELTRTEDTWNRILDYTR